MQADDEVPIWICGEPRFISGVTSTTTCNEIIQALIDDELTNVGNGKLHEYELYEEYVCMNGYESAHLFGAMFGRIVDCMHKFCDARI